METRANYVLIGTFTLAGIVAAVGFLLWLAKVEVDRQYAYYDVRFSSVAGLAAAGDVRYNGLQVGRVVSLGLDPEDPSVVRVRIEVAAETPVRTDTVARLEAQGVTGVSYVALSGGSAGAPALPEGAFIPSEPSALQSVFEGAPLVLDRTVALLENVNALVDARNRAAIDTMLQNLAASSGRIDGILANFEGMQADFGITMQEVARLSQQLSALGGTAETTLTTATRALETADTTLGTLNTAVATDVTELLRGMRQTVTTADTAIVAAQGDLAALIADVRLTAQMASGTIETVGVDLSALVGDARRATATATEVMEAAGRDLSTLTASVDTTTSTVTRVIDGLGADMTALVGDARGTLAGADRAIAQFGALATEGERTLASVNGRLATTLDTTDATLRAVTVAAGSAEATLGAAQTTFASVNAVLDAHLEPVVADLRRAVTGIAVAVDRASADFGALSREGQAALVQATATFARANATLDGADAAMQAATETLGTANIAFAAVNRLVEEDVGVMIADIRGAVSTLAVAVDGAAGDLTAIGSDMRATARSASSFVGTLDSLVVENRRPVSDFLRLGLPEFLRFTEEARSLVVNLERLVNRIERDPARFLLGTQATEFRR